jgi:hypothetical protein
MAAKTASSTDYHIIIPTLIYITLLLILGMSMA